MRSVSYFIVLVLGVITLSYLPCNADNKYSERANSAYPKHFVDEPYVDMRTINKPFRMAKLNMLWSKAQVRLTEPKLKSLFSELKVHDKEELAWKKLKTDGLDKDGMREAEMRRKFIGIMSTYGLLEHFEDSENVEMLKYHEPYQGKHDKFRNKYLFKDKKLNKLWEKAETSGFTAQELMALKDEFDHHQDKVDQYYSILNQIEAGDPDAHLNSVDEKLDRYNMIDAMEEGDKQTDYQSILNQLRDSHRNIKDDYDRLYRMTMTAPNAQEFVEPKVQGLWKVALTSNFTPDELESLKADLFHYEKRLLKLRHLQVESYLETDRRKVNSDKLFKHPPSISDKDIKHYSRKVGKLHSDLESRIYDRRHTEL